VPIEKLEAALGNLNLLMTQNGPGREYFGAACFSCDPAEPASIRAAIQNALAAPRPPNLATRLAEKFTWTRAAERTRAAYDAALAAGAMNPPAWDTAALSEIAGRMAELLYLKHMAYEKLETQARQTDAWAHELETIVAAHAHARARWSALPFARTLSQWLRRT
jgi:hypothetical protein